MSLNQNNIILTTCLEKIIQFASPKDSVQNNNNTLYANNQQFLRRFKRFFQLCSRVTSSWQVKIDQLFLTTEKSSAEFVQKFFGTTTTTSSPTSSYDTFRKIFE